jgi:hypothetical protein
MPKKSLNPKTSGNIRRIVQNSRDTNSRRSREVDNRKYYINRRFKTVQETTGTSGVANSRDARTSGITLTEGMFTTVGTPATAGTPTKAQMQQQQGR